MQLQSRYKSVIDVFLFRLNGLLFGFFDFFLVIECFLGCLSVSQGRQADVVCVEIYTLIHWSIEILYRAVSDFPNVFSDIDEYTIVVREPSFDCRHFPLSLSLCADCARVLSCVILLLFFFFSLDKMVINQAKNTEFSLQFANVLFFLLCFEWYIEH